MKKLLVLALLLAGCGVSSGITGSQPPASGSNAKGQVIQICQEPQSTAATTITATQNCDKSQPTNSHNVDNAGTSGAS